MPACSETNNVKLISLPDDLYWCCSKLAVPLILCNYDGFYDGLMNFLSAMVQNGTVGTPELTDIMVVWRLSITFPEPVTAHN